MKRIIGTMVAAALSVGMPATALAQSAGSVEVGGQFSALRLSAVDVLDSGIGGRIGWHFSDVFGIEGVADVFPAGSHDVRRGGRKFNALAGPRVVLRSGRVGFFGKGRAGVARLSEGRGEGACIAVAIFPPPESCFIAETRLAFDLGGGVEVYPSSRTSLRFEVGSLITRLGDTSQRFARNGDYAADLQFSAGVGFRF